MRCHLFLDFRGTTELLFNRSMQPPLVSTSHKDRTSRLYISREFSASDAHFDPAPTSACPDFEHDGRCSTLLPLTRIEWSRLVPRTWRDWRMLGECLPFCSRLFLALTPLREM